MKDLKIEVPEGYEVDKEKSTFERIVFKKKDGRVREVIDLASDIKLTNQDIDSINALKILLLVRQQWINDYDPNWKPNWGGGTENWCIYRLESDICVNYFYSQFYELSFPTQEMAEDFRRTFNELLRVYFKV